MANDNIEILLAEDSDDDIFLTKRALKENKLQNNLHIVKDGVEAIKFLHKEGEYSDVPTPDLILLDWKMPKKGGREVLEDIKQDPILLQIPVVVLTTSESDEDVLKAYGLHANCYITKPVDMKKFIDIVKSIEEFWFYIAKRPKR